MYVCPDTPQLTFQLHLGRSSTSQNWVCMWSAACVCTRESSWNPNFNI